MRRDVKGVLGGVGYVNRVWMDYHPRVRDCMEMSRARGLQGMGAIGAYNGPALWIVTFLIFSAGFYFGFRRIY